LACAAALATLEIFEENDILGDNEKKSEYMKERSNKFLSLPNVKEVRQQGMVTAIDLKGYDVKERIGLKLYEYALSEGVLLRPLGHIIYFMPPYLITYAEIDKMMDVAYEGIQTL
jgi:adenosylmethionine-8-amino-7-oxononanoate aminotransferase